MEQGLGSITFLSSEAEHNRMSTTGIPKAAVSDGRDNRDSSFVETCLARNIVQAYGVQCADLTLVDCNAIPATLHVTSLSLLICSGNHGWALGHRHRDDGVSRAFVSSSYAEGPTGSGAAERSLQHTCAL